MQKYLTHTHAEFHWMVFSKKIINFLITCLESCQTRLSFVTLLLILFCCLNGWITWESFSFHEDLFIHLRGTRDLIFFLISDGDEHFVFTFSCGGITCFMQSIQCFLTCSLAATKMRWVPKEVSLNPTRKADRPEENNSVTN